MTFYVCMKLLPQVLDLLLTSEDCFQDDTTANKLLDWLRTSSKTKEHYSNIVAAHSPVILFSSRCLTCEPVVSRTTFALKLLGILCEGALTHMFNFADLVVQSSSSPKKETCILDQRNFNQLLKLHFAQARQDVLWCDASVRCAWFEACCHAVNFSPIILDTIDVYEVAWECLDDSSMFVQSAAEDFLVASAIQQLKVSLGIFHDPQQIPLELNGTNKEQQIPQQQFSEKESLASQTEMLAPLEDTSKTLKNQSGNLQNKFLTPQQTFPKSQSNKNSDCISLATNNVSMNFNSEIFQKLIKIVTNKAEETCVVNKPDEHKAEDNCLGNMNQIQTTEQVPRKSAISVMSKLFKHESGLGLSAAINYDVLTQLRKVLINSCEKNTTLDVVNLLVEMMLLNPVSERSNICENLQDVPETLLSHQHEALPAIFLASTLWRFEARSAVKKKQMDFVMLPLVVILQDDEVCNYLGTIDKDCHQVLAEIYENKSTCQKVIGESLNSILEYLKQFELTNEEVVIFGTVLVKLLQCINSENEQNKMTQTIVGSTKLSKKCYDILSIICKLQTSDIDCHWRVQLFTLAVNAVHDPGTNITLLTKVLDVLSYLDSLYSNVEVNDLAFVIQKLLMNESSWEKRDCGIVFLDCLLQNGNDCIADWVCGNNFPRFLWERLSDPESYVRASAIKSLTGLLLHKGINKSFLKSCDLSIENVLTELCRKVTTDDGGFARRAAMISLTTLLTSEGAVQDLFLKFNPESCENIHACSQVHKPKIAIAEFEKANFPNDVFPTDITGNDYVNEYTESRPKEHDSPDTHLENHHIESSAQKSWNLVTTSVNLALCDLDWEVKLKALGYWDELVKIMLKKLLSENRDIAAVKMCSHEVHENDMNDMNVNRARLCCLVSLFSCLHRMGLQTLLNCLTDCDRLVGLSCCHILIRLRNALQSNGFTFSVIEQIQTNEMSCNNCQILLTELGFNSKDFADSNSFVCQYMYMLVDTDLDEIITEKSLLINDYTHNPLLLFQDIVAAATENDDDTDQLIDCY